MELRYPYSAKIDLASNALSLGGVIAYPTEAVWGLGCDPHNTKAIERLLSIKARSAAKGLILVASCIEQLAPYLEGIDTSARSKLQASWPGPVTWLVPDNGCAHPLVRGDFQTVALRVSAHPLVAALCSAFGGPIVSTSANISGEPTLSWPWQINRQLGRQLDFLLSGDLGLADSPSEIRDLLSGQVLRPA